MRHGRFLPTMALIALAATPLHAEFVAFTPDGTRMPEAPLAQIGGFRAVLEGLVAELDKAATHLDTGEQRRPATEALDRALQLAEFGHGARGVSADGAAEFSWSLEAVRDAHHELQMGRPEESVAILHEVMDRLDPSALPEAMPEAGPGPEDEGLRVLNMHGHRLGELEGVSTDGAGPVAMIAHGGFWSIGETKTSIPAQALLVSEHFAVLPAPVKKKDFGELRLRQTE